jgi:hypothetical protein
VLRRTMQQWLPQSYYSTVDGIRMLSGHDRAL